MSRRRWLFAGLALYLAALVFQAPAALLSPLLGALSSSRLDIATPSGSLWRGSAEVLCKIPEATANCGRWYWRLEWRALRQGRLEIELHQFAENGPLTRLLLSPGHKEITELDATLPASALALAFPKLAGLKPDGTLLLKGRDLSAKQGVFLLLWNDASSSLVPSQGLGNHQVQVMLRSGGADWVVSSPKGEGLRLDGQGSWTTDKGLTLDVLAESTLPALSAALANLGKKEGPGRYRLSLQPW